MPILVEKSDAANALRLEGEVDIASAADLKAQLVEMLDAGKEIRVDLQRTSELDVTAIQLLYAAQRDATHSGLQFIFEHTPQHLAAAMADAGLSKF